MHQVVIERPLPLTVVFDHQEMADGGKITVRRVMLTGRDPMNVWEALTDHERAKVMEACWAAVETPPTKADDTKE